MCMLQPPIGGVSMFGPSGAGNSLAAALKGKLHKPQSDEEEVRGVMCINNKEVYDVNIINMYRYKYVTKY